LYYKWKGNGKKIDYNTAIRKTYKNFDKERPLLTDTAPVNEIDTPTLPSVLTKDESNLKALKE